MKISTEASRHANFVSVTPSHLPMPRPFAVAARCLSLLPLLFILALWARTPWRTDFLGYSTRNRAVGMLSSNGLLRFEYFDYPFDKPGAAVEVRPADPAGSWDAEKRALGGGLGRLNIGARRIAYDTSP